MVLTDEDDQLFKKHGNLVNNLKLDEVSATQAWESYQNIKVNYTLEVGLYHRARFSLMR